MEPAREAGGEGRGVGGLAPFCAPRPGEDVDRRGGHRA